MAALVLAAGGGTRAWAQAQAPPPTPAPETAPDLPSVRIADLARLEGLRPNQLVGLGLVVGLEGTGDGRSSTVHIQMVSNMLRNFGLAVDPAELRPRNVASVTVTALLPAQARPGDRVDVTVSSLGDARSLAGGVLLQTPLQGADGEVYAVAQGALIVGGTTSRSAGVQRVHATVATIPGGAIVERSPQAPALTQDGTVRLVLYRPDFTTAARMVEAINKALGEPVAFTQDGAVLSVRIPRSFQNDPAALIARISELTVTPAPPARVVVNERTGTVVLGQQVRIAPVAVSHGGIRVTVGTPPAPSAAASSGAEPGAYPQLPGGLPAQEPSGHATMLGATASVGELVDALNAAGVAPRDVIAILEAIRAAGALYAELEVI